jgi:thermitase
MKNLTLLFALILSLIILRSPQDSRSTIGLKSNQLVSANSVKVEIPDDYYFDQQWELQNIHAIEAWNISQSSRIINIAILDSGIDSNHEDLAAKVVSEINFTDSNKQDKYGHGTAVAGIAAAIANNDIGIAGVGCNVGLMDVKVLNDQGEGSYSWIIQGIIWATDHGANIINLSMAGGVDSPDLKFAIDYAWNRGVLIVVAAGNTGSNIATFPAGYEHCIAVAATDRNDRRYTYSDYGTWIDVAAPGEAYTTLIGNKYGNMAGTSMAAPYVSGLAALAFTIARDTNGDGQINDEVRSAIENGCDTIADPGTGQVFYLYHN